MWQLTGRRSGSQSKDGKGTGEDDKGKGCHGKSKDKDKGRDSKGKSKSKAKGKGWDDKGQSKSKDKSKSKDDGDALALVPSSTWMVVESVDFAPEQRWDPGSAQYEYVTWASSWCWQDREGLRWWCSPALCEALGLVDFN